MAQLLLARSGGVDIYSPGDFFLSFFSSPYASHLLGKAVDISFSPSFGADFHSPVSGVVSKVVKVYSGLGPYSEDDYVIFVRSRNNYVKLMHIKPMVRVGDSIEVGDVVGSYMRSNYFHYHHLPHAHVEVVRGVTLRPTKSFSIYPSDDLLRMSYPPNACGSVQALELEVYKSYRDFTLCKVLNGGAVLADGVPLIPQGELGTGLGYLGLLHICGRPQERSEVTFLGASIGRVLRVRRWYSILGRGETQSFKDWFMDATSISGVSRSDGWSGINVFVNGVKVDGVEFLLSNVCNVKIVGNVGLRDGDKVTLKLYSEG